MFMNLHIFYNLNMLYVIFNLCIVTMFIIVDLQALFNTQSLVTFVIVLCTRSLFHVPISFIDIRPKE